MSPRKTNVLTVKGWANPKKGKLYKGVIREAKNKTQYVRLIIENLDLTQLGRIHEIDLPLPVRPSKYHKTCSFLMACGIDACINDINIDLNDITGVTIGMRFGAITDESQQVEFERIEKPSNTKAATFEDSQEAER